MSLGVGLKGLVWVRVVLWVLGSGGCGCWVEMKMMVGSGWVLVLGSVVVVLGGDEDGGNEDEEFMMILEKKLMGMTQM